MQSYDVSNIVDTRIGQDLRKINLPTSSINKNIENLDKLLGENPQMSFLVEEDFPFRAFCERNFKAKFSIKEHMKDSFRSKFEIEEKAFKRVSLGLDSLALGDFDEIDEGKQLIQEIYGERSIEELHKVPLPLRATDRKTYDRLSRLLYLSKMNSVDTSELIFMEDSISNALFRNPTYGNSGTLGIVSLGIYVLSHLFNFEDLYNSYATIPNFLVIPGIGAYEAMANRPHKEKQWQTFFEKCQRADYFLEDVYKPMRT